REPAAREALKEAGHAQTSGRRENDQTEIADDAQCIHRHVRHFRDQRSGNDPKEERRESAARPERPTPYQRAIFIEDAAIKALRSDRQSDKEVDRILRRESRLHLEGAKLRPVPRRIKRGEWQIRERGDADHDDKQRSRLARNFLDQTSDKSAAARRQFEDRGG